MKKIFVFPALVVLMSISAFSQIKLSGLTTVYNGEPTDEAPILAISTSSADDDFQTTGTDDGAFSRMVLRGTYTKLLTLSAVFDTAGAHIFVMSRHVLPKDKFEYRILKNDSAVVVPWTAVTSEETNSSDASGFMTYLGNFKAERGSSLFVALRRKGMDSLLSIAIISFRNTQPKLLNIFLGDEMKSFIKKLTNQAWTIDTVEYKKWRSQYPADKIDTATGLPKKLVLQPDQNSVIFYLQQQIRKSDQLEYQLIRDGKVVRDWKANDFDNGFVWLTNLSPGDYQLKMRFKIQRENVTVYPFIIKQRWDQTLGFKIIAGGLIAAFFGFLVVLYRLWRQKQKLLWTKLQKEKAETELRSVYSQLNPHFIFNSLSSIQGLINKKDTEKANHYLSTFSSLLRESLVNSEKDRVPLSAELKTLETYLQLEQLRFHFGYDMEVDKDIAINDVEIPSLLLQPLVENAIRHGVSGMQEKGYIHIRFNKKENDLLVSIMDNGSGFDSSLPTKGFGLKLTRERIKLLNQSDREHLVMMSTDSKKESGTTIGLQFKNWL